MVAVGEGSDLDIKAGRTGLRIQKLSILCFIIIRFFFNPDLSSQDCLPDSLIFPY